MKRKFSIEALFKKASEILKKCKKFYDEREKNEIISEDFRVEIFLFLVCLQSILEYLNKEILESIKLNKNDSTKKQIKYLHFPVFKEKNEFEKNMSKNYHNLEKKIFKYLESIQPFFNKSNRWLSDFNTLTNRHKHDRLESQTERNKQILNLADNISIIGGFMQVDTGSIINGKKVEKGFEIYADSEMPAQAYEYYENLSRKISRKFGFIFNQEFVPVPKFLDECYKNTFSIYEKMMTLLCQNE